MRADLFLFNMHAYIYNLTHNWFHCLPYNSLQNELKALHQFCLDQHRSICVEQQFSLFLTGTYILDTIHMDLLFVMAMKPPIWYFGYASFYSYNLTIMLPLEKVYYSDMQLCGSNCKPLCLVKQASPQTINITCFPWSVITPAHCIKKVIQMSEIDSLGFGYCLQSLPILLNNMNRWLPFFLLAFCSYLYLMRCSACNCKEKWKYATVKTRKKKLKKTEKKLKKRNSEWKVLVRMMGSRHGRMRGIAMLLNLSWNI